jgi:hypothetical protein
MLLLPLLFMLFYFIGIHYRSESAREIVSLHDRDSWPMCQNCDREMPPYDGSVVMTWMCPHCGESRGPKRINFKKPTPFDPDF